MTTTIITETSPDKPRRGRPRSGRRNRIVEQAQAHLDPEHPMTLRHLWYLLLSDGTVELSKASTPAKRAKEDRKKYSDLSGYIVEARMEGIVPFESIVDGLRESIKPSSWSGLEDFGNTVRRVYRKDLWAQQKEYVEFWFEKDAIIGVVEDIGREYDVKMRPLRGQSSLTFLYDAAMELSEIEKPIFIYYFGDHDPSGYCIENSARTRLQSLLQRFGNPKGNRWVNEGFPLDHIREYGRDGIFWNRLGFIYDDFDLPGIIPLEAKISDSSYKSFVTRFNGDDRAAELDALPTDVIRDRMRTQIDAHLDTAAWRKLQEVERLEQESVESVFAKLGRQ